MMKSTKLRSAAILFLVPAAIVVCTLAFRGAWAGEGAGAPKAVEAAVAPKAAAKVSEEEVAAAIDRAVSYIKSKQASDGSWPYEKIEHRQGVAALAVLALSEAGVPATDPAVRAGLDFAATQPLKMTYDSALLAMAVASANPGRYINVVAQARDAIAAGQGRTGMWGYPAGEALKGGGDNSNTQYAIMGLYAAGSLGLLLPENVLQLADEHYTSTQNRDGGWGYTPGQASYGAMTAAGVGALHILGARLYVESEECGQYKQDRRVAAGFKWLEDNYSVTSHPGGNMAFFHYYLYALERVGVLTGEKHIGGHDWYVEGARYLVDTQNRDGSWAGGRDVLPSTCFALLFLGKGNLPVLVNKLDYGGDWNVDVHDAENLTQYVSAKFAQRVGWQAVTLGDPVETLLSAPILYVTGHSFPVLSGDEIVKMKEFFENGGFMLAEACCGSKDFDEGFRTFAKSVFPDVPLAALERSHPIYRSIFNLSSSLRTFEGIEAGCRMNVIYSPKDLSCAWEKNDLKGSEEAFQFGANIAAYVTGKERLSPKLEQYKAIPSKKATTAAPGAFTLAQVVYATGRWNPHPYSGPKLLAYLNEKAGLTVTNQQVNVTLLDRNLANYPFIYFTGCRRFTLSDEEKKALKEYLERGGFLFSDAACGKVEFDEAFRALMQELFPSSPLEAIAADSPVYRIGFDTSRVTYTASVRELNPSLTTLTLYGVKIDGRTAVVYSPYDIGCALEGTPAYGSRGLVSEDAFKVASNVVLFALSH
jgi:hypothetical protein